MWEALLRDQCMCYHKEMEDDIHPAQRPREMSLRCTKSIATRQNPRSPGNDNNRAQQTHLPRRKRRVSTTEHNS